MNFFFNSNYPSLPGTETGLDTCSFKIYQSVSKNFLSAFYLVDELIDQLSIKKFQRLNEVWSYLVKVSCAQVFNYRLKAFSLLIKIVQKVLDEPDLDKRCINLFGLKPLKSLQISLESPANKNDRDLLRALYDLFFFAEKLAIKWDIGREYQARLRSKEELIERVCEVGYFIQLIRASFGHRGNNRTIETRNTWSNNGSDQASNSNDEDYRSCDEARVGRTIGSDQCHGNNDNDIIDADSS